MRDKLYEAMIFLSLYPRGLLILIVGVAIAGWLAGYGSNAAENLAFSGSNQVFEEAVGMIIVDKYKSGVLVLLGSACFAAVAQFKRDKKRFDSKFG